MPTQINMPQFGESETEEIFDKWLKQPGEGIEGYDALLAVLTRDHETRCILPEIHDMLSRILEATQGKVVRIVNSCSCAQQKETRCPVHEQTLRVCLSLIKAFTNITASGFGR